MGKIIKAYYAPDIDKSIISEGFICKYYGFRIVRDENKCIFINKENNQKLEIVADGTLYKIPDSAFTAPKLNIDPTLSSKIPTKVEVEVSLASVRPANPLVLLH